MKIINDVQIQITKPNLKDINSGGSGYNFNTDNFLDFFCLENFLNKDEIESILALEPYLNFSEGKTIGQSSYSSPTTEDIRYCMTAEILYNDITKWIYDKISIKVQEINNTYFHFDIDSINEKMQFIKYNCHGHKFDWHMDRYSGGPVRKFAVIIQLSNEEDYSGGSIELMLTREKTIMTKKIGSLIIFPSYILHRVSPILSGTRKSLLCLISGPSFR